MNAPSLRPASRTCKRQVAHPDDCCVSLGRAQQIASLRLLGFLPPLSSLAGLVLRARASGTGLGSNFGHSTLSRAQRVGAHRPDIAVFVYLNNFRRVWLAGHRGTRYGDRREGPERQAGKRREEDRVPLPAGARLQGLRPGRLSIRVRAAARDQPRGGAPPLRRRTRGPRVHVRRVAPAGGQARHSLRDGVCLPFRRAAGHHQRYAGWRRQEGLVFGQRCRVRRGRRREGVQNGARQGPAPQRVPSARRGGRRPPPPLLYRRVPRRVWPAVRVPVVQGGDEL